MVKITGIKSKGTMVNWTNFRLPKFETKIRGLNSVVEINKSLI